MPDLLRPATRAHDSFLTAMSEFTAEGRGAPEDASMIGSDLRDWSTRWTGPDGFAEYVDWLNAQTLEESPRPPGFVPSTTLWWLDGDEYLGRLAIRHRLTPHLLEVGGHIGYDVRATARRRGHATAMLRAALPIARALGIESALLTCDVTNTASRRVIETNGGTLEDEREGKYRFWVPTAPR